MIFGWLWFVLFWGGLIWAIVWAVNRTSSGGQSGRQPTPLDIVKERLARGEITEEEFQRLKGHIS